MSDEKSAYPKSYFYFAWPFAIDAGDGDFNLHDFEESITDLGWNRLREPNAYDADEMEQRDKENSSPATPSIHSYADRYAVWQYLSNDARLIFGDLNPARRSTDDKQFCHIFYINAGANDYYEIATTKDSYKLDLEDVELHLYRFGCGVLWIRTHSYVYNQAEETKTIADLGRRLSLPFLPTGPDGFTICAKRISLYIDGHTCSFDVNSVLTRLQSADSEELPSSDEFFKPLLVNTAKKGEAFTLLSLSDDRMFTMQLIRNDYQASLLPCRADGSHSWVVKPNDAGSSEFQKGLYEYIYVDGDDNCSCQDQQMREEILNRAILPRWIDYGTLHAVTNYSFFCLTGETHYINASVVRPFLNEYIYLASLGLAQRMGLTSFSQRAGNISHESEASEWWTKDTRHQDLARLQEQFVQFENQVLISEFTNQEQGIEQYQLLRKQLLIDQEQQQLNEQLGSLYEVVNTGVGDTLTRIGVLLAVLAIIASYLQNIVGEWIGDDVVVFGIVKFLIMAVAVSALTLCITRYCLWRSRR